MEGDMQAPVQQWLVFANGAQIDYRPDPDLAGSVIPTGIVTETYEAVNDAMARLAVVQKDGNLSPKGKAAKMEEIEDQALTAVATGHKRFAKLKADIDAAEAKAHAPPMFDPTDSVGFLADQARLAHLAKATGAQKTTLLQDMSNGDPDGLVLAIKRSPYRLGPAETQIANQIWAQRCRAADPARTAQIDTFRRSHEWGTKVFGHLIGTVNTLTHDDGRRLDRIIAKG